MCMTHSQQFVNYFIRKLEMCMTHSQQFVNFHTQLPSFWQDLFMNAVLAINKHHADYLCITYSTSILPLSPWYNRHGWLGVKINYLFMYSNS